MKTWILIAASGSAAVCFYDSISHSIRVFRRIRERTLHRKGWSKSTSQEKFSKYLSEEMDIACGAGTGARLVICAERSLLEKVMSKLSHQAKSSIWTTLGISHLARVRKGESVEINSQLLNRLGLILQE